jgi:hypothetical protein
VVSATSNGMNGDAVRTVSHTSSGRRYSVRAAGREEDIIYADMMKEIS